MTDATKIVVLKNHAFKWSHLSRKDALDSKRLSDAHQHWQRVCSLYMVRRRLWDSKPLREVIEHLTREVSLRLSDKPKTLSC
jgi:hypothetical protein